MCCPLRHLVLRSYDLNPANTIQTMHVSGALALKAGDRLRIYVYSTGTYLITSESGLVNHGRWRVFIFCEGILA